MFNFFIAGKDKNMKKNFYIIATLLCTAAFGLRAQENADFYKDIMISEELKMQDKMDDASQQARKLLEQKQEPVKLTLPEEIEPAQLRKRKPVELKKAAPENLSPAPFGLLWGATIADINDLGITLNSIEIKDYVNTFSAENLPKSVIGFRTVDVVFGQENELWRIIAYGDFLNDDASASKVMLEYRKYYTLLNKKYGNAQETYIPAAVNVDRNPEEETAPAFVPSKDAPNPQNAPDLLKNLQSGQTTIYATFQNKDTGAALTVSVDGEGKSYITIDYRSLRILRQREAQTLDAL